MKVRIHLGIFPPHVFDTQSAIGKRLPRVTKTTPFTRDHFQEMLSDTDWACPKTTDAAESLMITENFWESVDPGLFFENRGLVKTEAGDGGEPHSTV